MPYADVDVGAAAPRLILYRGGASSVMTKTHALAVLLHACRAICQDSHYLKRLNRMRCHIEQAVTVAYG